MPTPCGHAFCNFPRYTAPSRPDAERPELHAHAEHGHDQWSREHLSLLTLQRGNAVRDALRHTYGNRTQSVQSCILTQGMGTISDLPDTYRFSRSSVGMPFVTLCVTRLEIGRRTSRTACPRRAWARSVIFRTPIVPHAPAWECLS
ncbi:DUF1534 domain-containing protein [Pseudomonas congelans]|nr:DUF1534 domain-containing protein [Pseudomonas congelans]